MNAVRHSLFALRQNKRQIRRESADESEMLVARLTRYDSPVSMSPAMKRPAEKHVANSEQSKENHAAINENFQSRAER